MNLVLCPDLAAAEQEEEEQEVFPPQGGRIRPGARGQPGNVCARAEPVSGLTPPGPGRSPKLG